MKAGVSASSGKAGDTTGTGDELLTVAEVARLMKFKRNTIYTMAKRKELPCIQIHGRIRFQRSDILGWLEARKEGG